MKMRQSILALLFALILATVAFATPTAQYVEDGAALVPETISLAESSVGPFNVDWSCPAYTVSEKTIDIYEYVPEDTVVTDISFTISNILSSVTKTYNSNEASVTLRSRVQDDPGTATFSFTVNTENYGNIVFNVNIDFTGKYNVTISGVHWCNFVKGAEGKTGFAGTPTGTSKKGEYTGSFTYTYKDSSGTALEGVPTEIGKYTVTIAVPEDNEEYKGSTTLSFEIVENPEAYYTDSDNDTVETTLVDAIFNSPKNHSIYLISDVYLTQTIRTDKNFVLKGENYTITTSLDNHKYFFILDGAVTISDLTLNGGSDRGLNAATCLVSVGSSSASTANVCFSNVTVKNNKNITANGFAGGINVYGGTLMDSGNGPLTVENCEGYYGGGITVLNNGSINFTNAKTVIKNNKAGQYGGGICVHNNASKGKVLLKDTEITGNYSAAVGGAIYLPDGYSLSMKKNTKIHKNSAKYCAGGVWYSDDCKLTIVGTPYICENTSAEETDGGLYPNVPTGNFPTIALGDLTSEAKIAFCSYFSKNGMLIAEVAEGCDATAYPAGAIYYNGSTFSTRYATSSGRVYIFSNLTLDIGEKTDSANVRFAEIDGVQYPITESEGNTDYTITCGFSNYELIKITEKTSADSPTVVKSQYFYIDVQNLKVTKLDLDTYTQIYDKTSVRTGTPTGLRFKAKINSSAKDETEDYEIVEYGFIIAKKADLADYSLTFDSGLTKYVYAPAYVKADGTDVIFDDSNDEYDVFTGVLYNIPENRYKTDLSCRTYTKIKIGENTFTIYGETMSGNLYSAAQTALSSTTNASMREALAEIISVADKTPMIDMGEMYE